MQIGITGGIGSGKSLICRIYQCLGIPVYDADSRAKKLMTTDGILVAQIKKEFGTLSFHRDGRLNKEHLRKVFSQPDQLKKLNALVHPIVAEDYANWVNKQSGCKYVVKEAALLIESGAAKKLDRLIVVLSPVRLRIQRVLQRDPERSEQEVLNIIDNQISDMEKEKAADYLIVNDETRLVIPQVLELHKRFTSMN